MDGGLVRIQRAARIFDVHADHGPGSAGQKNGGKQFVPDPASCFTRELKRCAAQENVFDPVGIPRHKIIGEGQETDRVTIRADGWNQILPVSRSRVLPPSHARKRQACSAGDRGSQTGVANKDILNAVDRIGQVGGQRRKSNELPVGADAGMFAEAIPRSGAVRGGNQRR